MFRLTLRRSLLLITTSFLFIFFIVWFQHYLTNVKLWEKLYAFQQSFTLESFEKHDMDMKESLHHSGYKCGLYDDYIKHLKQTGKYKDYDPTFGKDLPFKCDSFFQFVHDSYPDYKFELLQDTDQFYDKGVVKKANFFKDRTRDLLKERKKNEEIQIITKNDNITINNDFLARCQQTKIAGQKMADTITLMRIYGQCFIKNHPNNLNNDILKFGNNQKWFDQYTKTLFYYLSDKLPTFENQKYNLDLYGDQLPLFNENNLFEGETVSYRENQHNLLQFLKENSSGKGIAISASTRFTKDIIKLIRVLRALNNKLPIQIIYRGDLNQRSKEYMKAAAQADIEQLLGLEMSPDVNLVLPELNLIKTAEKLGSTFPKQDIWFINLSPTISRSHKFYFSGYTNKVLALLFTTFKDVLLLDADAVPLVNPDDFFQLEEYMKSSALFFKDRTLRDTNDFIETNFFTKLMPLGHGNPLQNLDQIFGIKQITEKTLNNPYMRGWRHFQEAGIVAINKVEHFMGILMTLPLIVWTDPVKSSIWGDKEMYWLGLSMAGDENYEFNKYHAASVGEATISNDNKYYPDSKTNEVCSSHPGHVSSKGDLLWINSGFSFCKKNGYFKDRLHFPFSTFVNNDLQAIYQNPLRIRNALIPPATPPIRGLGSPPDDTKEREFINSWKKRKEDIDQIKVAEDDSRQLKQMNPQKGWVKSPICSNYYYCAYDEVDQYILPEGYDLERSVIEHEGKLFSFSDDLKEKYDFLGKIWVTGNSRVVPKSKNQLKKEKEDARKKEEAKKNEEAMKKEQQETKSKQIEGSQNIAQETSIPNAEESKSPIDKISNFKINEDDETSDTFDDHLQNVPGKSTLQHIDVNLLLDNAGLGDADIVEELKENRKQNG